MILGNKNEHPDAVSEFIMREAINLPKSNTYGKFGRERKPENDLVEVFMCSAKEKEGYMLPIQWLIEVTP